MGQTVPTGAGAPPAGGARHVTASDGGQKPATPAVLWQSVTCQGDKPRLLSEMVKLTREVDYLALYTSRTPGFMVPPQIAIDAFGTECSMSPDVAACDAQVAMFAQASAKCYEQRVCGPFAVLTDGDGAQRLENPDDGAFLSLLGPIDSAAKAVLAAFWEGLWVACPKELVGGTNQVMLRGTEVSMQDAAWVVRSEWETCGPMSRDTLTLDAAGKVLSSSHEDLGHTGCVVGRRPAGLQAASQQPTSSALGAFLAGNARLEAASVWAFERLASELRELGAPVTLICAARDAAHDERRHTQLVAQLARTYGAEPSEPTIDEIPQRSPFAIALENAVEGCVRETFGALLAHYQAALAADPAIAWAMMRIAEDETRHAELAWQVAAWLEPTLSSEQHAELRAAQAVALDELQRELALEGMSAAEHAALGWPPTGLRAKLLESMAQRLGLQAVA